MRRQRGYALISTMVIGFCAIAFLIALASMVTGDMQSESRRKQNSTLLNAAEAGLDYAVNSLNNGDPLSLDPDDGEFKKESSLPPAYLEASFGSISNHGSSVDVTITIKRLKSTDWPIFESISQIYSAQLDPYKSVASTAGMPPGSNLNPDPTGDSARFDYWRIIESRATAAGRSRTLRSVIQPVPPSSPSISGSSTSGNPLFKYALFGNNSISIAPPPSGSVNVYGRTNSVSDLPASGTAGQGFNYNLTVSSNLSASIGEGATLQGNLLVTSSLPLPTTAVADNTGTIEGRLIVNGAQGASVSANPGSNAGSTDNVLANADRFDTTLNPVVDGDYSTNPTRINQNNTTPLLAGAGEAPFALSVTPTASANSSPLSSLAAYSDQPIKSGDYQSAGLSTGGLTEQVQVDGTATNPVRLFIKENPNSSDAVNVDASMFSNLSTDPRSLQIFYSGSKPINIDLSSGRSFVGLVYAPLSTVSTTGNGLFDGAIVANKVQVQHTGDLSLRTDLATQTGLNNGLFVPPPDATISAFDQGWRWRPVTWEEVH